MAGVIDLDAKRPSIHYTVRMSQRHDGTLEVWVEDVADTPDDRARVADALRRAASMLDKRADSRS